MEVQLRKWDADVDELRTRGKQMAVELRAGYFGRIKELRTLTGTPMKIASSIAGRPSLVPGI